MEGQLEILNFLVHLMSGAMLLLFSVRFMRIGIERLWSTQTSSGLNDASSMFSNLTKGVGLGFLMQGATVVMLMVSGLAGTGAISLVSAALVALGADLGSAIAVQFLQLPVSALGPVTILIGASLYLRSSSARLRNAGRAVLGLGLVFLSLAIIRAAVAPLGEIEATATLVDYVNQDIVTAALAGVVLTLVMHSSVAALLTAVAFASHTALGPVAGLAFMLGCNLGSSLLPVWLLKYENKRSRVVAISVAIVRSSTVVCLFLAMFTAQVQLAIHAPFETGAMILSGHIAFNVLLMFLAPLCVLLTKQLEEHWASADEQGYSILPVTAGDDLSLVLSILKRELSAMLEITASMLEQVTSARPNKEKVDELEQQLNTGLARIRQAYAQLPNVSDAYLEDIRQIVDFAIRVERCGDVLSGKLIELRLLKLNGAFAFSREGETEIAELVTAVRQVIILAQETSWTGNVSAAQRLVRHKQNVATMEADSRSRHLARLRLGNLVSLGSSDQHLEMIAALKEVNSRFATIGYAVLDRHGGLKKSRLKNIAPKPAS